VGNISLLRLLFFPGYCFFLLLSFFASSLDVSENFVLKSRRSGSLFAFCSMDPTRPYLLPEDLGVPPADRVHGSPLGKRKSATQGGALSLGSPRHGGRDAVLSAMGPRTCGGEGDIFKKQYVVAGGQDASSSPCSFPKSKALVSSGIKGVASSEIGSSSRVGSGLTLECELHASKIVGSSSSSGMGDAPCPVGGAHVWMVGSAKLGMVRRF